MKLFLLFSLFLFGGDGHKKAALFEAAIHVVQVTSIFDFVSRKPLFPILLFLGIYIMVI